ncbi:PAS domain-containing protein [Limibacter armeniacum]|uniref:PAS domain-containing protein n=1 Tax=Limibacter armeniacum TaxID=466084 RepID=UPI002FE639CA
MDAFSASAWVKTEKGVYKYINQHLENDFLQVGNRIIGFTDFDLTDLDTAKERVSSDQYVIKKRKVYRSIERITFRNDTYKDFLIIKFPIPMYSGSKTYVGGFAVDISEHSFLKKQVHSLKKENKRLNFRINNQHSRLNLMNELLNEYKYNVRSLNEEVQNLIGHSKQAMIILNQELEIERYNEEANFFFKLTDSSTKKSIATVKHMLDKQCFLEVLEAIVDVIQTGQEKWIRLKHRDGIPYTMHLSLYKTNSDTIGIIISIDSL